MDIRAMLGEAAQRSDGGDRMEYALFPDAESGGEGASHDDLVQLRALAMDHISAYVKGYIWHTDSFALRPVTGADGGWQPQQKGWEDEGPAGVAPVRHTPSHLYGCTRFGDSIEDEWFIVWLLLEITKRFPNITVAVRDTDGEFLLIEAAYVVPRWLKPDSSANRVWLRRGEVHLIPPPRSPADVLTLPAVPQLHEALRILQQQPVPTRASDKVQQAIQRRLQGYPAQARENQHTVRCWVPLRVAHVLRQEPQLLAPAVEAFYHRDVDTMQAAARMATFLPQGPNTPMVHSMVTFSRALYAQMEGQVFEPPKCYPSLPLPSHPLYHAASLGLKLAVGFEMMYADRARYAPALEEGESLADSGEMKGGNKVPLGDPGWEAFRRSLEKSGYFQGLLEGSVGHRKLLDAAVARYQQTAAFGRVQAVMHAPARKLDDLLASPASVADFPQSALREDDSSAWMGSGEEELAREMSARQAEVDRYEQERSKKKGQEQVPASNGGRAGEEGGPAADAAEIADSMRGFVEKLASFEGAELPHAKEGDGTQEGVELHMDRFLTELQAALGLPAEAMPAFGNEDVDSDDSDLGSMSEDEEEAVAAGPSCRSRMNGAHTPGDSSEEEEEDAFQAAYAQAMEAELRGSSLPQSFQRAERADKAGLPEAPPAPSGEHKEELAPLDVDLNLVQNLLESYSAQQGLPGPASNLLGTLGIKLPSDSGATGKAKEQSNREQTSASEGQILNSGATQATQINLDDMD